MCVCVGNLWQQNLQLLWQSRYIGHGAFAKENLDALLSMEEKKLYPSVAEYGRKEYVSYSPFSVLVQLLWCYCPEQIRDRKQHS